MHLKCLEEIPISHLFAGIWRQRRLRVYKSQHFPNHGGGS